jgi:hypothetical protein
MATRMNMNNYGYSSLQISFNIVLPYTFRYFSYFNCTCVLFLEAISIYSIVHNSVMVFLNQHSKDVYYTQFSVNAAAVWHYVECFVEHVYRQENFPATFRP